MAMGARRECGAQEFDTGSTASTAGSSEAAGTERTLANPGLVAVYPVREDDVPATWSLGGEGFVGRSREALVRLVDARVSRLHARVEPREDGFFVRDCSSRHGTFARGAPVSSEGTLVPLGGVIRCGDTLLLCVADIERFRARPRRSDGARLGLSETMLAGPQLAAVWDEAARAASLDEPVLILGESGSGKECVARMLHASRGVPGPFVGINVTAIPEPLFESELFGHERGAFTGAVNANPGAFREAARGVLFLDEVGDLKLEMQAKLLRALDQHEIRPLGARDHVRVDTHVVSATSRDLKRACDEQAFRADLYYRLAGIVIRVPPLCERPGDALLLAHEVLRQRSASLTLSPDAAERLALARWEGNARQLRYTLARAVSRAELRSDRRILVEDLPELTLSVDERALTLERIQSALERTGGVASHAARSLGVSRTTFYKTLKRLNGQVSEVAPEK
jgi:DNA-binding NtrC family response regulator